ncbi:MAG: hypothetical protein ACI4QA_03195 [Candidatus Spyradosoma sp.]
MSPEPPPVPAALPPRKKRFRRLGCFAVLLSACLLFAVRFFAPCAEPSEIACIPRSAVEDPDEFRNEANEFSERTVGRVFNGKTRHFGTNGAGWLWASCLGSEDGKFIYVHAVH